MSPDAANYFAVAISHIVIIRRPMIATAALAGGGKDKLIQRTHHVRPQRSDAVTGQVSYNTSGTSETACSSFLTRLADSLSWTLVQYRPLL